MPTPQLVTQSQYSEVYRAVKLACDFIELKPMPLIFIMHGQGMLELFLIKRFTKRGILVFTSETIDNLLESGGSRQLMMLIGRQLGHLKLGHYKKWFFKDVLGRFTLWFWTAWKRRCHYSADRIGMLVAGDFEASQRALITITVGKHLSDKTNIQGIIEQENVLRDHFFAKWQQLYNEYPYMIYRITELETYKEAVFARPIDLSVKKSIGFLPPKVNTFQIANVIVQGSAIFGDQGNITSI